MTRQFKGTKYRKWKTPNQAGRKYGSLGYRRGYLGRVHLQFWHKADKYWSFVCGKPNLVDWGGPRGHVVDDSDIVTCIRCTHHAPDVVEYMDDIPDLESFQ